MRPRPLAGGLVAILILGGVVTWSGGTGAAETSTDAPIELSSPDPPIPSGSVPASTIPRSDPRVQAPSARTANWAPFIGTIWVACTQGNPSPWGVCSNHHSYTGAIDFPMAMGTPVRAAGSGEVVRVVDTCENGDVACEGGGGNWVGVEHHDGQVSRYMHLDTVAVDVGDWVYRLDVLGTAGITGNATSSHLHYDEQNPIYTRGQMGDVFACHGTEFVRYPEALGYDSWADVPYGTEVRSDGDRCAGDLFFDLTPYNPFEEEVAWMAGAGLTDGFDDGTFHPFDDVTRQAIAAWLHRLAGSPGGLGVDPGFSDVARSHPFYDEIAWMVATGRADGFADDTFRPLDCVTRQAIAAFLHREGGAPTGPFADPGFTDVSASHPFADEIAWLAHEGITSGYPDDTFRPTECVTRQAAAAFLFRLYA